ncbi:MAG TPA: hypothetical protein VF173_03870 [Thermoanaerobaculia bacterium]|nr:hypothetical protein [Thermoanaerobaculia bacterium]
MANEYELEALPELEGESEWEGEGEGEWEWEAEGEEESEEFFRRIVSLARRAASSPALRQVGLRAARGALSGLGGVGAALGGSLGGARGASLGRSLGGVLGQQVSSWLPQREGEWEFEEEYEVNPIRRIYPDALMEHLGHAAAETESEAEAEAFLGALVPLAARLIPRAASAVMRVAPNLIRGVAGAARTLRANPATRPLVRALPTVVRRTTATLARQAQQGRRVTPQAAVRTLARQTSRVIGSPAQCAQAYRRSRALDRTYHRSAGPVASATGPAAALPAPAARALASGAARPAAHLCTACRQAVNGAR